MLIGSKSKKAQTSGKLKLILKKLVDRGFIPCLRILNTLDFGICPICSYMALELKEKVPIKTMYWIFGKKEGQRPKIYFLDYQTAYLISKYDYTVSPRDYSVLTIDPINEKVIVEDEYSEYTQSISFPQKDGIVKGMCLPEYSEFISQADFRKILVVKHNNTIVQISPVHPISGEEDIKRLGDVPLELLRQALKTKDA